MSNNIKKKLCDDAMVHYKKLIEEKNDGNFHPMIFMALVYYRQIPQLEEDSKLIQESLKELKEKGIMREEDIEPR